MSGQKTPSKLPSRRTASLRRGGSNRGGPGRPPNEIRIACLNGFWEGVPRLKRIIRDGDDKDATAAMTVFGRFGGLEKITIEDDSPKREALAGEALFASLLPMAERLLTLAIASRPAETVQKLAAIEAQVVE